MTIKNFRLYQTQAEVFLIFYKLFFICDDGGIPVQVPEPELHHVQH